MPLESVSCLRVSPSCLATTRPVLRITRQVITKAAQTCGILSFTLQWRIRFKKDAAVLCVAQCDLIGTQRQGGINSTAFDKCRDSEGGICDCHSQALKARPWASHLPIPLEASSHLGPERVAGWPYMPEIWV